MSNGFEPKIDICTLKSYYIVYQRFTVAFRICSVLLSYFRRLRNKLVDRICYPHVGVVYVNAGPNPLVISMDDNVLQSGCVIVLSTVIGE